MLYNEHNLAVAKFASKSDMKPELASVFFRKDKTVATDSFRLLEVTTPANTKPEDFPNAMRGLSPFLVPAKAVAKIKIPKHKILPRLSHVALKHVDDKKVEFLTVDADMVQSTLSVGRIDGMFPKYEQIFPSKEPEAEFTINGELFSELLATMAKVNELKMVKVKIYGEREPIVLEAGNDNQKARGMLMRIVA